MNEKLKYLTLFVIGMMLSLGMNAQSVKSISGTVTDDQGEAVISGTVKVKNGSTGTITDINGKYTLSVPSNATLVFSYIGYITQEFKVSELKSNVLNVVLQSDTKALDEVVVVGYGTMRKSDLTGSISTAKGKDMLKAQSFNALDGLKGKVAGVNIFSNTGQPGGESRVIIRGISTINASASPLYVVDGVVMSNFELLNPNDIESIEVLKDASSAAIYGARGANGVIMVTTKRGNAGKGVHVSYDGSLSIGKMARKIDVMDANEWMSSRDWKMPTNFKARTSQLICHRYSQTNVCSMQTVLRNIIPTGRMKHPALPSLITIRSVSNVQEKDLLSEHSLIIPINRVFC